MSEPWYSGVVGRDIAVDLGTANTLVYVRGRGVVLDEPSVVAVNSRDGRPLAVGIEAKRMIGRTPGHIQAIRPLKDGVIADFDICEKMLRYFIQRVHPRTWSRPRMVICVPSGITGVEQRAVQEAAESAGARKPAHIIEEPMAAAIGAGLPVHEPAGNMIVDIGGGTTEVAVISLGGIVASESIRIAGDELDEAIVNFVKKEYSLALGERTAEEIKIALGSACPLQEELYAEVRGRDLVTGLPKTIVVSTREIREAIEEPVTAIVDAVKVTLDKTPPELAADIMTKGIVITGGGALLLGLRERLSDETGMPIVIADNPLLLGGARVRPVPRELQGPQGHGRHAGAVIRVRVALMIGYRRANRRYILLVLVLTAITLITLDSRRDDSGALGAVGRAAHAIVSPIDRAVNAVTTPVGDWFDGITDGKSLKEENRDLRAQFGALEDDQRRAEAALTQNETFRRLLELPVLADIPRVNARIVNRSIGNFDWTITLDKGAGGRHLEEHGRTRPRRTRRSHHRSVGRRFQGAPAHRPELGCRRARPARTREQRRARCRRVRRAARRARRRTRRP